MTSEGAVGLPAPLRRERMLERIAVGGFARVGELAEAFGVSEVTVRTDLDVLARHGDVDRVHGGAIPKGALARMESPFEESRNSYAEEKSAIAALAAGMVSSGDSVILDVGSTTAAIAGELAARDDLVELTVVTNGLSIALELERASERIRVIVTGGTLRPLQHSLVDPLAGVVLDRITADIAFIGCNGVDAAHGVTNINLPEAELKRLMIRRSARTVVVADSSKIGVRHIGRVASLDEVDALITGQDAPRPALAGIRDAGVRVGLADPAAVRV